MHKNKYLITLNAIKQANSYCFVIVNKVPVSYNLLDYNDDL